MIAVSYTHLDVYKRQKHTSSDLESLFLFLPDFRMKEKNHAHIHTYGLQITKSSIFI